MSLVSILKILSAVVMSYVSFFIKWAVFSIDNYHPVICLHFFCPIWRALCAVTGTNVAGLNWLLITESCQSFSSLEYVFYPVLYVLHLLSLVVGSLVFDTNFTIFQFNALWTSYNDYSKTTVTLSLKQNSCQGRQRSYVQKQWKF